jgi:hypothetical protein
MNQRPRFGFIAKRRQRAKQAGHVGLLGLKLAPQFYFAGGGITQSIAHRRQPIFKGAHRFCQRSHAITGTFCLIQLHRSRLKRLSRPACRFPRVLRRQWLRQE